MVVGELAKMVLAVGYVGSLASSALFSALAVSRGNLVLVGWLDACGSSRWTGQM